MAPRPPIVSSLESLSLDPAHVAEARPRNRARVAWVGLAEPDANTLAALEGAGVHLGRCQGAADALRAPLPQVLVVEADLPDGDGIELAGEIRRRAGGCPFFIVVRRADFELARRAFRAGATDVLLQPPGLPEIEAVLQPAEAVVEQAEAATIVTELDREGSTGALRELLSALTLAGFGPAMRARAASAVAELLENVLLHAHPTGTATATVRIELESDGASIRVSDEGGGFEAKEHLARARERAFATGSARRLTGLARVEALAERFDLVSHRGAGTVAKLWFRDQPASFSDHDGESAPFELDLGDREYLPPSLARRLLAHTPESEEPWFHLPPALSACMGRFLAGPLNPERAQSALWRT